MTSIPAVSVNNPNPYSSAPAVNLAVTGSSQEQVPVVQLASGILQSPLLSISSAASLKMFRWKKLLEKLESLTPQSNASHDSLDLDLEPKTRLANLPHEGKISLNLRRKMLSLISIERDFLKTAALEARSGMQLSLCVGKMEKCGIKASNDGSKWQFEVSIKMPEAPEGFAFFWPLLHQLGTHDQTTELKAKRFRLRSDWCDKLQPKRRYLEESSRHTHEEVRRLAEGYLAMLTFKENTGTHRAHYQLHRQRLESLLEECSLLGDRELLTLFSTCTPALYRLLIIEIKDLLHTSSQNGDNEFPMELYGQKTAWHNFAKGGYHQSQNALYESLMAKLPSKIEFRNNFLYQGGNFKYARGLEKRISGSQEFIKIDPYLEERDAKELVQEKLKPSNKNKTEISQASSTSQTLTVVETPPPPAMFSCLQNPPPFPYDNRVKRWFKMEKKEDPKLERERVLHSFHPMVDQLIWNKTYSCQKDEKWGQVYFLSAQFNFEDGTFLRGIVYYVTFVSNDGKETCYQRYFSQKGDEEFLHKKLEEIFEKINQDKEPSQTDLDPIFSNDQADEKGLEDNEIGTMEGNQEAPQIEFDPFLCLIKIHDKANGLVISLFGKT